MVVLVVLVVLPLLACSPTIEVHVRDRLGPPWGSLLSRNDRLACPSVTEDMDSCLPSTPFCCPRPAPAMRVRAGWRIAENC
jgi:hypothetical protein